LNSLRGLNKMIMSRPIPSLPREHAIEEPMHQSNAGMSFREGKVNPAGVFRLLRRLKGKFLHRSHVAEGMRNPHADFRRSFLVGCRKTGLPDPRLSAIGFAHV